MRFALPTVTRLAAAAPLALWLGCATTDTAAPAAPPVQPTAPSATSAQNPPGPAASTSAASSAPQAPAPFARLDRRTFNQRTARLNLPLFWRNDDDRNGAVDPGEVVSLRFFATSERWVDQGRFTPAFAAAYERMVALEAPAATLPADERARRVAVAAELDNAAASLVFSDLSKLPDADRNFVARMLEVSRLVDDLYAITSGARALESKVPADDPASQSVFRRNWGTKCVTPGPDRDPACSAIPGAPAQPVDIYPAKLQRDAKFCEKLEKHPQAKRLLDPFVVVRETPDGKLIAVPYAEAYKPQMTAISAALSQAAAAVTAPAEGPLRAYLEAAAASFVSNDFRPADEAWAKMNATNSAWYVRVAPDETYWEPCSHKAGFHATFARINPDSLRWQKKLEPVQQEMEDTLARLIGAPYAARKVTFHLPDFIDIVTNAGDDRDAVGATIGQSLPNWGPVANQGRGRTVAMSNLYTDPDSLAVRRAKALSWFTPATAALYVDDPEPGLVATILHEATHNLGPAHQYTHRGKTADAAFGGDLASMLEELKSQTGALWYVDFAAKKGIISPELARRVYVDCFVWALNHVARGMWTADHKRKHYGQLAAIQLGFLLDEKALSFDPAVPAANGADRGAFTVDFDRLPAAVEKLMKHVGSIKASNDRAAAEALSQRHVDGPTVPRQLVTERALRFPQPHFVYALDLR